ncbi:MAG: DEAD/DEAH box helicase [Prevotellaceae bacterium]|jgi:replicative superfamily II helicase|nr:DEAD/DEAH box helicase [Prevotellaceae bacterium]
MNCIEGLPMKPDQKSLNILKVTRSKAKMLEFNIPEQHQNIDLRIHPQNLFFLTIGLLGDYAYLANQSDVPESELIEAMTDLRFSAQFFDSYLQAEFDVRLNDYLILVGSATYYLCDQPGNAIVLARKLQNNCPDLDTDGLSILLLWLLQFPKSNIDIVESQIYGEFVPVIKKLFSEFIADGMETNELFKVLNQFRKKAYDSGSARQLLFADIISAIVKRKYQNSCWVRLPLYSDLSKETWESTIKRISFIKEIWPSQKLIGEKDVLKGHSAIIQMPTSAGKTKASEIIIRSSFLSERTSLAIIIAPFRALCHEISNDLTIAFHDEKEIRVDELNDIFQIDIPTEQLQGKKAILVVTPEKLLYVLSHNKDIARLANLFIFDEGHQFDNDSRGITYELLLTTLLLLISQNAQKVLISAVIQNAKEIGLWLNNNDNVVSGDYLLSTFRTIGFVSWTTQLGQIKYVQEGEKSIDDFFVPRVIEQLNLKKDPNQNNSYLFPTQSDWKSIALYLGLKLLDNGSIAIFCGTKRSVTAFCNKAIETKNHGLDFSIPKLAPNAIELQNLANLYIANLGIDCPASKAAILGIFSHHNNIPHGLRMSVEYAMHEQLIRFIVCTSTLAQGVNLPIRYLIVSSVNQGEEPIKVRDFHNLIGRTGRAGIHTEGSIIFADPAIYDNRNIFRENSRWKLVQDLLEPNKNEPCISKLPMIFEPLKNEVDNKVITLQVSDFINNYFNSTSYFSDLIQHILTEMNENNTFTEEFLEKQLLQKSELISSVENFMLSNWDEIEILRGQNDFSNIVTKTLGYALADDEKKVQLLELFNTIESYIRENIKEPERRQVYGKTLRGIHEAQSIEIWYKENESTILLMQDEMSLLDLLWVKVLESLRNPLIEKLNNVEKMRLVLEAWISGKSYAEILAVFSMNGITRKWGRRTRRITIDNVVNICDSIFSFDGCLVVNSIAEFAAMKGEENKDVILLFQSLQRRIKYGLPDDTSIVLFEIGFCDRVISQDIKEALEIESSNKTLLLHELRTKNEKAKEIISKYPAYYQNKMRSILYP